MTVLLIEDDANCRMAFRFLLSAPDIFLSEVSTLAEAIKHLQHNRFDLVIADLKLPDSNATETIARVSKYAPPESTLVAMTGLSIGLDPEVVGLADAAIQKDELPDRASFLEWLRALVSQKQRDGRVCAEAKRICAWLKWKSEQNKQP